MARKNQVEDNEEDDFLLDEDEEETGEGMADEDVHQPYQFEEREVGTGLAEVYDRHKRVLFLVDRSGSMESGMLEKFGPGMLTISDSSIEAVRNEYNGYTAALAENLYYTCEKPSSTLTNMVDAFVKVHGAKSDSEIRQLLGDQVEVGLYFGGRIKGEYRSKHVSKMDQLKRLASKAAQDRLAKYPESKVTIVAFDGKTQAWECKDGAQVEAVIKALRPSGASTDIVNALRNVIGMCKKAPSQVNMHHVVLVTDGEDYGLVEHQDMLIKMLLEVGIILDVITIYSDADVLRQYMRGIAEYASSVNAGKNALEAIAKATNGTTEQAKDSASFETRFLGTAQRLCLPAPTK